MPAPALYDAVADGDYTLGFRPHHLAPSQAHSGSGAARLKAQVAVTEITGSESFVHLNAGDARWVMLTRGIHDFDPGLQMDVWPDTRHLMVFDAAGRRVAGGEG